MKRHPLRSVFEWLGLVRTPEEQRVRFRRADKAIDEGLKEVAESRARRERLAVEVHSHRRGQ